MNKYQKAISVTEHYRETKSRFTWIGEIEDENLLSALEKLSDDDLEILTLYIYEGYSTVELSKVYTHLDFSSKVSSANAIVSIFPENTKV